MPCPPPAPGTLAGPTILLAGSDQAHTRWRELSGMQRLQHAIRFRPPCCCCCCCCCCCPAACSCTLPLLCRDTNPCRFLPLNLTCVQPGAVPGRARHHAASALRQPARCAPAQGGPPALGGGGVWLVSSMPWHGQPAVGCRPRRRSAGPLMHPCPLTRPAYSVSCWRPRDGSMATWRSCAWPPRSCECTRFRSCECTRFGSCECKNGVYSEAALPL